MEALCNQINKTFVSRKVVKRGPFNVPAITGDVLQAIGFYFICRLIDLADMTALTDMTDITDMTDTTGMADRSDRIDRRERTDRTERTDIIYI